jgi:hypothetical protein
LKEGCNFRVRGKNLSLCLGKWAGTETRMQALKAAGKEASQTQPCLPFFLSPLPRRGPNAKGGVGVAFLPPLCCSISSGVEKGWKV